MMNADVQRLHEYARTGDAEAFSALVGAYQDLVYGACLRVLGNAADAEDAAQDCFIELARQAARVRSSLGAWLHRRATHHCLNLIKQAAARRKREQEYGRRQASERETMNDQTSWQSVAPEIDRALNELPDELRQILVEHFLRRRSQDEIAGEIGVSPATVSRRVSAGVEKLRELLKKAGVIVPAAALVTLLAQDAAVAAPATLSASLGKMALAGVGQAGEAVVAGKAAAIGKGIGIGLGAAKVKVIAAAAAAAVIASVVGGAVIYQVSTGRKVDDRAQETAPMANLEPGPAAGTLTEPETETAAAKLEPQALRNAGAAEVTQVAAIPPPPPSVADKPQEAAWKIAIRKQLDKKVAFEFVETPLHEALRFLQDLAEANIILDQQVMESGAGDTPINLKIGDMTLNLALKRILLPADLTYTLRDDSVFIHAIGAKLAPPWTPPVVVKPQTAWEEAILWQLEMRVSFEFVETPLVEAIRLLQKMGDVAIILDPEAFELPSSSGPTMPITLRVENMRLWRALNWVMRLADLTYTLRNEAVFIHAPGRKFAPSPSSVADRLLTAEEQAIRKQLRRKVSFKFVDTPFKDAIAFLQTLTPIEIVFDPRVRAEKDMPINLKISNMTLKLGLDWMLRLADLKYTIKDGVVVIHRQGVEPEMPARVAPPQKDSAEIPQPAAAKQAKLGPKEALAKQINAHILALDIQEKAARRMTYNDLAKIGVPAVPPLLRALQDKDSMRRRHAAYALGIIGPKANSAVPALTRALKDEVVPVRLYAATALVKLYPATKDMPALTGIDPAVREEVVTVLVEALQAESSTRRKSAAWGLGKIGPAAIKAVPSLIKALGDDNSTVRRYAAQILGTIGPEAKEAVHALCLALQDKRSTVVRRAADALRKIGPEAIPVLVNALKADNRRSRYHVADVLGDFGPAAKEAVPALIRIYEAASAGAYVGPVVTMFPSNQSQEGIRVSVAQALGRIGPDARSAVPVLVRALEDKNIYVRRNVAQALGRIGPVTDEIVPALLRTLLDPDDEYIRVRSAEALGTIGAKGAKLSVPALIQALKVHDSHVRRAAIEALGKIGPAAKEAVPALQFQLAHPNAYVKKAAKEAIPKIDPDAKLEPPPPAAPPKDPADELF